MTRRKTTNRQAILNDGAAAQNTFTADQAPPTPGSTAQAHVFPVVEAGSAEEVDFIWQIKARYTAVAGDGAAFLILHCFDADKSQWYQTASMEIRAVPTPTVGNALTLDGVLGSTHCAFQVTGVDDGDDIEVLMRPA